MGGRRIWGGLAAAVCAAVAGAAPAGASAFSLRADADRAGVMMGSAATSTKLDDAPYASLLERHVNTLTFEDEAKWAIVHPERDRYDFTGADRVAAFAQRTGMEVRGHVLVWHQQNPRWLVRLRPGRAEAIALLRDHITTVVGHFRDRFPGVVVHWDVANEVLEDDGTPVRSIWREWIGDDYLDLAFRFAREAAGPRVALYINEIFDRGTGVPRGAACDEMPKCRAMRELVGGLVRRGVPIDGVGFQGHLPSPERSDYRALTGWVRGLGRRWAITELDVRIPEGAALADRMAQGAAFAELTDTCLDDTACDGVIAWGLSDRHSWLRGISPTGRADATPFDEQLVVKPAADELHRLLAAGRRCPSRRRVSVVLPRRRGERVARVVVRAGDRHPKALRGHRRRVRVSLRGLRRGEVRVRLDVRLRRGERRRTETVVRRYRICAPRRR